METCSVSISSLVTRNDNTGANITITRVNAMLNELGVQIVNNDNIGIEHFGKKRVALEQKRRRKACPQSNFTYSVSLAGNWKIVKFHMKVYIKLIGRIRLKVYLYMGMSLVQLTLLKTIHMWD